MSGTLCLVCSNPKRKPRFQTRSVCICQWCITELTNSLESPGEIIEAAKGHMREKRLLPLLTKLEALQFISTAMPALSTPELERAAVRAKQQVLEREGIGQFLYRQVFDSAGRDTEVVALTKQLQSAIVLKHEMNLKSHEIGMQKLAVDIAERKDGVRSFKATI